MRSYDLIDDVQPMAAYTCLVFIALMNVKDTTLEPELAQHREDTVEAKRTGVRVIVFDKYSKCVALS